MMKIRLLLASLATLLAALTASAQLETVLTSDSVVYTVDHSAETPRLLLSRRTADMISAIVVPATEDEAMEAEPRLIWDRASSTLFVVWTHRGDAGDEIRMARMDADGQWAEPITVARGNGLRRVGLQIVLTRAETDGAGSAKATLIHAVWWSVGDPPPLAEYALVAFEGGEHVSTDVSSMDALTPAEITDADASAPIEDTGVALHPPMAMARTGSGVDVVYGRWTSTAVRRISLAPSRIVSNARAWRPVGKTGESTGRTGLVSSNSAPVQAFVSQGRIVLYTPETQFRYMVWSDGTWSPLYRMQLDKTLTSDQLVEQLHRTVDDLTPAASPAH